MQLVFLTLKAASRYETNAVVVYIMRGLGGYSQPSGTRNGRLRAFGTTAPSLVSYASGIIKLLFIFLYEAFSVYGFLAPKCHL
jgi:hypothetical protein